MFPSNIFDGGEKGVLKCPYTRCCKQRLLSCVLAYTHSSNRVTYARISTLSMHGTVSSECKYDRGVGVRLSMLVCGLRDSIDRRLTFGGLKESCSYMLQPLRCACS